MTEKKSACDAAEWAYNRYIKGDPEMEAYCEQLDVQAALAQQIYDIRNRLHMTREELAEFSGLTPEAIEDLEETDYDGDWNEAIQRVNHAFRHWFTNVIVPAAQMKPDDYSVKAVSA